MTSPTAYGPQIATAARAHGLAPDLVEALVLIESSGRTWAYRFEPDFWTRYMLPTLQWKDHNPARVSASYGLCQVMFVVAIEVGFTGPDPEYLFVPTIGLEYGCRKLEQLLRWAKGNVTQALCAYNGGRGGNQAPPFRNQRYADRVLQLQAALRQPVTS